MAYSGDYIDDDFFQEVQCDVCDGFFPMYLLTEHVCKNFSDSDDEDDEPTIEEIEAELVHAAITDLKEETNKNKLDESTKSIQNGLQKEITPSNKNDEKCHKKMKHEENHHEVIEDNFVPGSETTFRFGNSSTIDKKVEEEKPTYRVAPVPILGENERRPTIQNHLPDSDNEEGESLEDFWKRAEIKLQQRLRAMEKNLLVEI